MERILICQPMGGINDMLCQIGNCIAYAEKYNRKLIIDTTTSDLNDYFSNYFLTNDLGKNIQLGLNPEQISYFCSDPKFPSNYLLTGNNLNPIIMDFEREFTDKYLLHRYWGGGLSSIYALKHFKLLDVFAQKIKQKKIELGNYHAIMIRHRDYNTDYVTALIEIKKLNLDVPLFLFTDNYIVQDYAKTLNFKKLYINESLHKNDDVNLPIMCIPKDDKNVTHYEINTQVLMDLFLAALSEHIYPTYLQGYIGDNQFVNKEVKSGFINLAIELKNDRQLLQNLLG